MESWYERFDAPTGSERWVIQSGIQGGRGRTLPSDWARWYEQLGQEGVGAAVGAFPTDAVEVDSLDWLIQDAWLTVDMAGEPLRAFGGVDSTEAVQRGGSWQDGVWYLPAFEPAWASLPRFEPDATAAAAPYDFAQRSGSENRFGRMQSDGRLVWRVETTRSSSVQQTPRAAVSPSELSSASPFAPLDGKTVLGSARNHRSGKSMDLVLEDNKVVALEGDQVIWELDVASDVVPQTWEVDLYRNGKYQVAVGAGKRFHLIDVLGRSVNGFPKKWSDGFSAYAVFDYDKNRQFRFLMAAPNGQLFNFRKEGERTPGWKFSPRSGRYIVSLTHLRMGPKDYIVAGQDDGSVRILSRTGEDRLDSPLRVPVDQPLAFRIGKNLNASTVLYIDDEGWVQERTIAGNEAVGMSGMTKGNRVRVEDRTGDGIPEVVVATSEGEEVWNARNQRLGD